MRVQLGREVRPKMIWKALMRCCYRPPSVLRHSSGSLDSHQIARAWGSGRGQLQISTLACHTHVLVGFAWIAKIPYWVSWKGCLDPTCCLWVGLDLGVRLFTGSCLGKAVMMIPPTSPNWFKMSKKHGLQEDSLSQNIYWWWTHSEKDGRPELTKESCHARTVGS